MTATDAALKYAAEDLPVFPCSTCKRPIVADWGTAATTDPATIIDCWGAQMPHALIGMPTGERTGIVVLDIDMKHGKNGLRTLAELTGCPILPAAPTVLTPTGGCHLHFTRPEGGLPCTVGGAGRGIGDGLDWRGDGGYVVLPSPGSGYSWGALTYDNCALTLPPAELLPRKQNPLLNLVAASGTPTTKSLGGVLRCLHAAAPGERNRLLFWACCRFAEAVSAGVIGEEGAQTLLHQGGVAIGLPVREIAKTIRSAFSRRAA